MNMDNKKLKLTKAINNEQKIKLLKQDERMAWIGISAGILAISVGGFEILKGFNEGYLPVIVGSLSEAVNIPSLIYDIKAKSNLIKKSNNEFVDKREKLKVKSK